MAQEPLIKLEPGGKAPILSYNVPEPSSYSGRNFTELEYPRVFFTGEAKKKPLEDARRPLEGLDRTAIISAVENGMITGFADRTIFPNVRLTTGGLRFVRRSNPGFAITSVLPTSPRLAQLDPDEVASMMQVGKRLNFYRSMFGTLTYNYVPEPTEVRPRLLLVETYRLSSFLGSYGAGRIVKTFTLLPGEKTKISVRTFRKTERERKSASSVLDSFTEESSEDFERSVQNEQSSSETYAENFEYHAEAEASAGWGWGSAKVSGGVKGGTNSAREEAAKNISSATQKHSAKASAQRDIQINTSYEVKEVAEEETSIERELENINLSRTLNYVFRQMNQEFISLLHLVDVRVAFFNGFAESKREVPLPELDSLLEEFVVAGKRAEVRKDIVDQLKNILDYEDNLHSFVEEKALSAQDKYLRVKKDFISKYKDRVTGTETAVPGIILSVVKNVLRTEGVIVEALLGEGEALDEYATRLQQLEVASREEQIAEQKALSDRAALLNKIVQEADAERAKLLADLTCPCGPTPVYLAKDFEKPGEKS